MVDNGSQSIVAGDYSAAEYVMIVVFVIVTYQTRIDQSSTIQSLVASLPHVHGLNSRILVFDNSEAPDTDVSLGAENCIIVWCGENRGLAKAYNDALDFSVRKGAGILVTLDQDSVITPDYLNELLRCAQEMRDPVVALCPRVLAGGRLISPYTTSVMGCRRYGRGGIGVCALNAMSGYSVQFLRSIGGFDEFYWLDALDFSTYARIAKHGKGVIQLQAEVRHELSLLAPNVSETRLMNISYYEACSLGEYEGISRAASGLMRLLVRAVKQARRGRRLQLLCAVGVISMKGLLAGARRRRLPRKARLQ